MLADCDPRVSKCSFGKLKQWLQLQATISKEVCARSQCLAQKGTRRHFFLVGIELWLSALWGRLADVLPILSQVLLLRCAPDTGFMGRGKHTGPAHAGSEP